MFTYRDLLCVIIDVCVFLWFVYVGFPGAFSCSASSVGEGLAGASRLGDEAFFFGGDGAASGAKHIETYIDMH